MDNWTQYGLVGLAVGAILLAVKDVLKEVVTQAFKRPSTTPAGPVPEVELARSIDRLAGVLERMEKNQEKALDQVLENQRRAAEVLGRQEFQIMALAEAFSRFETQMVASSKRWVVVGKEDT